MAETKRLTGKPVADALKETIREQTAQLKERGVIPTVRIFRVGARKDDISYERGIVKSCGALGVRAETVEKPQDVSQEALIGAIREANADPGVHGILLFRPLPAHMDAEQVCESIAPQKDIDAMTKANLARIFEGKSKGFVPCTAKAVVELLHYYEVPLSGANVVVAGRSLVVGKPLAMLLLDENCTVTICHSRTVDMKAITSRADIVVAAIGKPKFFDASYFSEGQTVVDVGINVDPQTGKMCGDVDYEAVFGKVAAINPAVGGVGAITTTLLIGQAVEACRRANA